MDYECHACGARFLTKSNTCPFCKASGTRRNEDEITKKVIEDSDLFK